VGSVGWGAWSYSDSECSGSADFLLKFSVAVNKLKKVFIPSSLLLNSGIPRAHGPCPDP
jgi:hypothetical protein